MRSRRLLGYLFRSLLASWATVAGVLLLVLAVQQVSKLLERVVSRQLAPDVLWQALGWATLANLPTILPISLLLAVVLAFGRLASDSELTAMRACGLSPLGLLLPVSLIALPLAGVQAAVALHYGPDAMCSGLKARSQVERTLALGPVQPGVFQSFSGDSTYFIRAVDADGTLRNVFIERAGRDGEVEILLALRGRLEPYPEQNLIRLRLFDGRRYAGRPGTAAFRILEFEEYQASIPLPVTAGRCTRVESRPTAELVAAGDPEGRAELNWRLGMPVTILLLALLSVPLSAIRPRQGRFVRMPAALGIFFVYISTAIGLTSWSVRNPQSGPVLFWTLHGVVLVAGLAWLARQQGWLKEGTDLFSFRK
jgi:lipopolysaccharide export system permease protein